MSARDRAKWNSIYKGSTDAAYPRPDLLLLDYTPPARDRNARALDLAGGRGQNGLWLATQGYTADIIDISRVALDQTRAEMELQRIRQANLLVADLDRAPLETDAYDIVCVFRYLNRPRLPDIAAAVKTGGRIIYETFTLRYLDENPDFNPAYCLREGELSASFVGWRPLLDSSDGPVARFVAIKP